MEQIKEEEKNEKVYNLEDFNDIFDLVKNATQQKVSSEIKEYINNKLTDKKLADYHLIILYDTYSSLSQWDADRIYNSAKRNKKEKDILLVINHNGGSIEPAYLICKACKKLSKGSFKIVVPRIAKSAATLISLGGDEIHMGIMSELGPIDPQINGYPALGLGMALNYIANLTSKYPNSYKTFSEYLSKQLDIKDLGYFERVSESAVQYAERLLESKTLAAGNTAKSVSEKLVYEYKDHSFVIDADEMTKLLGKKIIKSDTTEYELGNEIYNLFSTIEMIYLYEKKIRFSFVGDLEFGIFLKKEKEK